MNIRAATEFAPRRVYHLPLFKRWGHSELLMPPKHIIHIGRNKAASTTLQQFFLACRDDLAAMGIDYFLWGKIAEALPKARGFVNAGAYARYIADHRDRSTLISSEDLLVFGPASNGREMLDVINTEPVRIIAYVRDYVSWLASQYVEAVMGGFTTHNCDEFFRLERRRVSVLPMLKVWADEVGWEAMHVRPLDARSLHGGGVVTDCAHVLGLAPSIAQAHAELRCHVSPHWLCVEIVRALRAANGHMNAHSFIHDVVRPLRPIIDAAIGSEPVVQNKVEYWTAEQAAWLTSRYNADAEEISGKIGVNIPPTPAPTMDRFFIPSIKHVPAGVLSYIRDAIGAHSFASAHPSAAWAASYAFSA